jgi:hypothetical protein
VTPSPECRRQARLYGPYDRMQREEPTPVPSKWFWVTAVVAATMWFALTLEHHPPVASPKPCFSDGC